VPRLRGFAQTGLKICYLLNDVTDRKASQTGILRTALSVWQVTVAAGKNVGRSTMRNDLRHCWMTGRMPAEWRQLELPDNDN
jgi:hypothetical protein